MKFPRPHRKPLRPHRAIHEHEDVTCFPPVQKRSLNESRPKPVRR